MFVSTDDKLLIPNSYIKPIAFQESTNYYTYSQIGRNLFLKKVLFFFFFILYLLIFSNYVQDLRTSGSPGRGVKNHILDIILLHCSEIFFQLVISAY